MHTYGNEFSTSSAQEVLPFIFNTLGTPQSVIDVGCGIGTWLSVCNDLGVKDFIGLDGQHVLSTGQLLISDNNFMPVDFEISDKINLNKKYEFLISLEVAEHLKEKSSENFVNLLTSLSDIILFSAAVPGQTGMNHFNEQYPDYWQKKFESYNFHFFDIRSVFWGNNNVEWWYQQNMFLVVNAKNTVAFAKVEKFFKKWGGELFFTREMLELYTKTLKSYNTDSLGKSIILTAVKSIPLYFLNRILASMQRLNC